MNWLGAIVSWIGSLFGGSTAADSTKVTQIQAAAVKACGFLPMAESVAAMISAGNPAVISVAAIAGQICTVVKAKPVPVSVMGLMEGDVPPPPPTWGTVNGVPIQGVFIK